MLRPINRTYGGVNEPAFSSFSSIPRVSLELPSLRAVTKICIMNIESMVVINALLTKPHTTNPPHTNAVWQIVKCERRSKEKTIQIPPIT